MNRREFIAGSAGLVGGLARQSVDQLGPGEHPLKLDSVRDGVLYIPKNHKPGVAMPLVVMFHGAAGTGLSTRYSFPFADEFGFIVLAPDSRDERTWDLVLGEYGPDMEFLQAAFKHTLARCAIDQHRMCVAGHSDGASYSLSFGISNGSTFGHIIALSPGIMSPAAASGKPPIFIAHGTRDQTVPIDITSRKFVPRLRALGYDVTYREYAGGHAAPPEIVHAAFEWMQRAWGGPGRARLPVGIRRRTMLGFHHADRNG